MTAQTPSVVYLDDPAIVLARASWLLRRANRLLRVAPRMRAKSRRQECLRLIDVLLDRAEDLVRHMIDLL